MAMAHNRKLVSEKVTAVREMLSDHRTLNEDIDNEIERLERMKNKAYSVGAVTYSDMPKSSSHISDRTADLAVRITELESEIKEMIAERDCQRKAIEIMVKHLHKSGERAVIKMRYLDTADWDEIQRMMFGRAEDYEEKYDKYRQRMFRLHNSAVEAMSYHFRDVTKMVSK